MQRAEIGAEGRGMSNDRVETAYHEAGHALASLTWGSGVEYVTVKPDAGRLGHVHRRVYRPEYGSEHRSVVRQAALSSVRVDLAGFAAEELLGGQVHQDVRAVGEGDEGEAPWLDVFVGDMASAVDTLAAAFPAAGVIGQRRRILAQYRLVLAYLADHLAVLDDLATELLARETLTGDEVCRIEADRVQFGKWRRRGMPTARPPVVELSTLGAA
jgi:ATP-dependent Zn protease